MVTIGHAIRLHRTVLCHDLPIIRRQVSQFVLKQRGLETDTRVPLRRFARRSGTISRIRSSCFTCEMENAVNCPVDQSGYVSCARSAYARGLDEMDGRDRHYFGARQLTRPEACRLLTFTRCRICHVPASQPVKHPSDHALFDRTSPKSYQPCTAFLKKRSFFHITRAKTFLVVVANKKYIGSIRP